MQPKNLRRLLRALSRQRLDVHYNPSELDQLAPECLHKRMTNDE
ncbi:hypothetical protein [Coleofasciculus sp. F4-SAH-05]